MKERCLSYVKTEIKKFNPLQGGRHILSAKFFRPRIDKCYDEANLHIDDMIYHGWYVKTLEEMKRYDNDKYKPKEVLEILLHDNDYNGKSLTYDDLKKLDYGLFIREIDNNLKLGEKTKFDDILSIYRESGKHMLLFNYIWFNDDKKKYDNYEGAIAKSLNIITDKYALSKVKNPYKVNIRL